MKTITKENTKYIKNFYGITVEEIEKEVNDWCAEENAIIDQIQTTYLPAPDKNPHRTFILFTILYHYCSPLFTSKHFDND